MKGFAEPWALVFHKLGQSRAYVQDDPDPVGDLKLGWKTQSSMSVCNFVAAMSSAFMFSICFPHYRQDSRSERIPKLPQLGVSSSPEHM